MDKILDAFSEPFPPFLLQLNLRVVGLKRSAEAIKQRSLLGMSVTSVGAVEGGESAYLVFGFPRVFGRVCW